MPISDHDPAVIIGLLVGLIVGLIITFSLIKLGMTIIVRRRCSVMFVGRSYNSPLIPLYTLSGYRATIFGTVSIFGGLASLLIWILGVASFLVNAPELSTTLVGSFLFAAIFIGILITIFGFALASFFELLSSIGHHAIKGKRKEKAKRGEANAG